MVDSVNSNVAHVQGCQSCWGKGKMGAGEVKVAYEARFESGEP